MKVRASVPWTLRGGGPGTRTVYVRFVGGPRTTGRIFTDDITVRPHRRG